MTKISIIIPVYELETKYLRECFDSVRTQSMTDIEMIFVDDGARPELGKMLDGFASQDPRVVVLHQENQGVACARNAGLLVCKGEYVTFVDSDDTIAEDMCKVVYERATRDQLQVLLWGSYKCYDQRREEYQPYLQDIVLFSSAQKEQLQLKTMVGWLPFYEYPASNYGSGSACSKLYLVSFLQENGLSYIPHIQRAEDVNFNIRVFEAADRIGYLNKHFYNYRQRLDSATYQYRENGILVFTKALGSLEDFLKKSDKPQIFWDVFEMRCLFFYLESMDMDYLNSGNQKPYAQRMTEMKKALLEEPYQTAVRSLKLSSMSIARKIPLILCKLGWVKLLALFYSVFKKIK